MKFIIFLILSMNLLSQTEEIDTSFVSNLNKIGRELILKDKVKSKELLDSAFEYAYKNTAHYWLALTYQSMGLYHLNNDSLLRASDYLELSARAFGDIKYFNEKAYTNLILADLLYSIGRNDKAINILYKSLKDKDKLYDIYLNNLYLKLSENYKLLNKIDSATYFNSQFDVNSEILDFKIDIDELHVKEINEKSQIHDLEMDLKIEKKKSEFVIWIFLILIIILVLVLIVFIVKLYKTKKELFNLKNSNK